MAIKAHLDQPKPGTDQRLAPRRALRLETSGVAPGGAESNVTVHNISAAGLLLETDLTLREGEELALALPEAGLVNAVVVWRSERLYGCAFAEALTPAALAAAQLRGLPPGSAASRAPLSRASAAAGEALGPRLNRLRREAGLTLADVAAALGVSKPTVWAWEKGKARPMPERLDAIAAALGVSAEALAPAHSHIGEIGMVIEQCRMRIAEACGADPMAVRIMVEL